LNPIFSLRARARPSAHSVPSAATADSVTLGAGPPTVGPRSLTADGLPRIEARGAARLRNNTANTAHDTAEPVKPGAFTAHDSTSCAAHRAYKLYVPASGAQGPRPLLMMLHGCQQDPDDFAAGTRMNQWADVHGFLVAYPAQTARENGARCWSWFEPLEQERDGAEPSQIVGIVSDIAATYELDMASVFVAGLSAGAAMAVILGETYPEIFAAVGAHSGLPWGAAHSVSSAFSAMRRGNPQGTKLRAGSAQTRARSAAWHGVPTIVFHGDSDHTVAASNGEAIVEQALHSFPGGVRSLRQQAVSPTVSTIGHDATTTRYVDKAGRSRVESWAVHGGAHAWSGGSTEGSFTDPEGPDASAEMVRFFLGQQARRVN
jgi:poly(hydroxyalkanoate) depolymerase family esterase